jgi:hypothetical protein
MNLFEQFKKLAEGVDYSSGTGYTARVISKNNKHVAKFFKNGEHMKDADYEHKDPKEVHDFAKEEMEVRSKQKNEDVVDERILEPQGHKESADPISDDSLHGQGKGRIKKMMGNRNPIAIIAKILAKG